MPEEKIINDSEMFLLLQQKYRHEVDAGSDVGKKEVSIFKDWILLFHALHKLKLMCIKDTLLDENSLQNSEQIRELFISLISANRAIFTYKHEIHFKLFNIFKSSLEKYDRQYGRKFSNTFLHSLSLYVDIRERFPIQQCLSFYSIFKNLLALNTQQSNQIAANQERLMEAQKEIIELFRRYGGLYVFNVTYQLKLTPEMTSRAESIQQFNELLLIEQQIVSDKGLLKVLFNFEDDGLHGCLLNCILIYPLQLYSNANKTLIQLKRLAENCTEGTQIKFNNIGFMFKEACGEDVVGMIDQVQKLEKFLYWSLGSFYRYEDFFHYCCPLIFNVEINHEQVLEPWTLRLKPIQIGFMHRLIHINQTELMNAIKDTKEVWSTNELPKSQQQALIIDRVVLSEIFYELNYVQNLNGEILHFIQVFDVFLNIGTEPFFYFSQFKDVIVGMQPSRLGRQLIYLINLFSQQPNLINEVHTLNFILSPQLNFLVASELWMKIKELAKKGSLALSNVETLNNLNKLRSYYRPDQLSAKLSEFQLDFPAYVAKDLALFHRRNRDAGKYFEKLLRSDQLICRFKFYADVERESFLDKKEVFSKHLTEFLRIHKRSGLLKVLKGYFLVWLIEIPQNWFEIECIKKPYVDVIFMIEPTYGFDVQDFLQKLNTEWRNYLGKKPSISEDGKLFRTSDLTCDVVMHSDELLNSNLICFEKNNRKLKKALLEKLLPYFTYRHFYFPKLYDDKIHKKIKMFSKGQ
ncbi:MAG: hypothetical protein WB445_09030 [Acinetobacter sp.]